MKTPTKSLSIKPNKQNQLCFLGESLVCLNLKRKGYNIIKRNYRKIGCEIDIIAERNQDIIIVEVKTRTQKNSRRFEYEPASLVPLKKKRSLIRGTLNFLTENDLHYLSIRSDLAVALYDPCTDTFAIEYYQNIDTPALE
jgi:putative endonuclease